MLYLTIIIGLGCGGESKEESTDTQSDTATATSTTTDTTTTTDTDTSTETSIDCSSLSVDECEEADCFAISGRKMQKLDEQFCVDWEATPEIVGCTSEASSEAVVSFAGPPDDLDSCYAFPSGTIPEGWVDCATTVLDSCQECIGLNQDQCTANDSCMSIGGMAMTATSDGDFCIDWNAEGSYLGCSQNGPCGDAETYARPPDYPDVCWYFSDTCIPEGWIQCGVAGNECE